MAYMSAKSVFKPGVDREAFTKVSSECFLSFTPKAAPSHIIMKIHLVKTGRRRGFCSYLFQDTVCPFLFQIEHGKTLWCPRARHLSGNYLNFMYCKCILLLFYPHVGRKKLRLNYCLQPLKDQLVKNGGNMKSSIYAYSPVRSLGRD